MAQSVTLDVEFKLTDRDYHPLPGRTVRVVFGEAAWPDPGAGRRFTTDAQGEARFTVTAPLDRRTSSTNLGFTGLRIPKRTDHLAIAAELEHRVPAEGQEVTVRWLYTLDVDRFANGDCSTVGINRIFEPDAAGRFTRRVVFKNLDGWREGGYKDWNSLLEPPDEAEMPPRPHWRLKLAYMELPGPVHR